ncbi:MAG TPA: helix-turn-helix domain-containing protein [Candidatus Ruania gallistercoris]|uniref:Helix-turn-helix domain-containing protein n=1 Tax=Candidatus Ruania gallistercoris TaxID=2838746 RepID=A0A9D2EF15_9MICO|nr:helix-turn-helix domain-containing protein [Candidatus Ruania gallistercoris]
MEQRFLSLADVTEILAISMSQARALVRSGELRAIQVGGKGTWRVENSELEDYIQRQYAKSAARLQAGDNALDSVD